MSQQINLFNPLLVKQHTLLTAVNLCWALVAVLLLVGAATTYLNHQITVLNEVSVRLQDKLRPLNEQVASFRNAAGAKAHNPNLEKDLVRIEAEIQRRQSIASILRNRDFGNTEGYSSYMEAFARQVPNGVWLTGFRLVGAGAEISLQGRTLQPELVPVFVNQLKREEIMRGKTFSVLNLQRPDTAALEAAAGSDKKKSNEKTSAEAAFLEFELHTLEKNDSTLPNGAKVP